MENCKSQNETSKEDQVRAWNLASLKAAQKNIDRHLYGEPAKVPAATGERVTKAGGFSNRNGTYYANERSIPTASNINEGSSSRPDPFTGIGHKRSGDSVRLPTRDTRPPVYTAPDRLPPHLRSPGSLTSIRSYSDAAASKATEEGPIGVQANQSKTSTLKTLPQIAKGETTSISLVSDRKSSHKDEQRRTAPSNPPKQEPAKPAPPTKPTKTMNPGTAAKHAKQDSLHPCSYAECSMGFGKLFELKEHKEEEHDWCKKCDVDCEDWNDLVQHKISSPRHIACQFCGEDFKSEAGKDRHERQAHPPKQIIPCYACGEIFSKGAGLMAHIESNQCPKKEYFLQNDKTRITSLREKMMKNRAAAALHLDGLAYQGEANVASTARSEQQSAAGRSTTTGSGGIAVQPNILDSDVPAIGSELDDLSSIGGGAKSTVSKISQATVQGERLRSSRGEDNKQSSSTGEWSQRRFPDAKPTPVIGGWTQQEPTSRWSEKAEDAEPMKTDWDHHEFTRDIDGKYQCPFTRCEYLDKDFLKMHLSSGVHHGTDHRCIKCLKLFGSTTALIAHMESGSERCGIRDTKRFGHVIHIISGGFLGMEGRDERDFPVIKPVDKPDGINNTLSDPDRPEDEHEW